MTAIDIRSRIEVPGESERTHIGRHVVHGAVAALILCLLALFGRIMTYPLQHDEQFYVSAGVLLDRYSLYPDLGFSHLPNVALLFSGAFAVLGDGHYLLVGRLIVFASWIATITALLMIARDYARSMLVGGLMVGFLLLNPMFLNATGMAATNNFLPIPFALFGLYLFLRAADAEQMSSMLALASGFLLAVAAGFKINYALLVMPVGLAALLAPPAMPLAERLRRIALPMLVGGVIGGLPTILYAMSDIRGFIVHVIDFQRGPQLGYWAAHSDPADPKVIGMADKLLLAHRLWLSGVTMLMIVTLLSFVAIAITRRSAFMRWPVMLVAAICALGALLAFVPTPSFPQYFTPALPFLAILAGLLFGTFDQEGRRLAQPLMAAVLLLTVITGAPLLLPSLTGLAKPAGWTGLRVARDGAAIAAIVRESRFAGRPIATLSPLHALEGGIPIYPHFALGPFVYRAAPWVREDQRRYFAHFVTADDIPVLLNSRPPAAILTGIEGNADAALDRFAQAKGYRAIPMSLKKTENGEAVRLYLPR
ncbi:hypothetical protein DM806_24625 [Sphingobium lactosutens]|uniref:hypothetical protein n=1 Tax=Sphingobium lactosutens TaxID=522773 RepID=UPI0015BEE6A8|nr:hypothetical protein [Sphingobium lactosutens]NWK98789.1 hypothetical protein [Sphingobium lactosutens]